MKPDNEIFNRVAQLAQLEFKNEEKDRLLKDFANMLAFVEKLNEIDTTGVDPLIYLTDEPNLLRQDIPLQEINHAEALKNSPKKDSDYFRVPKVIEQ